MHLLCLLFQLSTGLQFVSSNLSVFGVVVVVHACGEIVFETLNLGERSTFLLS